VIWVEHISSIGENQRTSRIPHGNRTKGNDFKEDQWHDEEMTGTSTGRCHLAEDSAIVGHNMLKPLSNHGALWLHH